MNFRLYPISVIFFLLAAPALGSSAMDGVYRLKTLVPLVIDIPAYPVYSDHVEAQLVRILSKHSRFELPMKTYLAARDLIPPKLPSLRELQIKDWQGLPTVWDKMEEDGVDAVLFGEVRRLKSGGYRVRLALVNTQTRETIIVAQSSVESKYLLESFTHATRDCLRQIVEAIPFDGHILKRRGYLVILDKGAPLLENGMRIPTYTLEKDLDRLTLQETGQILLTKVQERISFGRIVLEKKPYEVTEENKFVLPGVHKTPAAIFRPPERPGYRGLASIAITEKFKTKRQGLGHIELDLAGHLVTFNSMRADGTGVTAANHFFPGGKLNGELWLTRRWIGELGIAFALSTLSNSSVTLGPSQNATINAASASLAYYIPLGQTALSPSIRLRGGLLRKQFDVDASPNPVAFASTTYRGFTVGTSLKIPLTSRLKFGVDIGTLLIGSVSEFPAQVSTASRSVSAWNFALNGIYRWGDSFDLIAQLKFHSSRSEFEGINGGTPTFITTSQSVRSLSMGLAYYF